MAASQPSPRNPADATHDLDATVAGQPSGELDVTALTPDLEQTAPFGKTRTQENPAPTSKPAPETGKSGKAVSQIGDYKIIRKLGKGGMGEVYLAHQISLDRQAALKVLSKQFAGKEDFVKRFYREARSMAKIHHPNAVRVYEVREDLGIHYVAMEFIDGKSMQNWMDELGKLSVGDAVHVVLRCAEALHRPMRRTMIHRDIKPDNIMLTGKGVVKVADFGLAKALDDDLSMTQSGTGLGTPYYMAPEQARNAKHVDCRADIYALGVTLYYFLTGNLPFTGSSTIEVIQNKEIGRFTAARKRNPQVSERLELVIDKMLLKDPVNRFKDCAEFMKALSLLGLENPSLSFIDAPDKVVVAAAPAAVAHSTPSVPAVKAVAPKTSVENPAARERKPKPTASESAVMWFVQHKNPQGRDAIAKFATPQVIQMLKAGSLDPRSKAKRNAADSFLPLTQIAEFEKTAHSQMVRVKAETKAHGLRTAYAEIDRQEKWWKFSKKIKGFFSSVVGFLQFLVWLAIVFGTISAAIYFGPSIWKLASEKFNAAQVNPGETKTDEKSAEQSAE